MSVPETALVRLLVLGLALGFAVIFALPVLGLVLAALLGGLTALGHYGKALLFGLGYVAGGATAIAVAGAPIVGLGLALAMMVMLAVLYFLPFAIVSAWMSAAKR